MKTSEEQVHAIMLKRQEETGRPPTLEEIAEAVPSMAYKTSVMEVVRRLRRKGLVEARGKAGESRRYIAVEEPDIDIDELRGHFVPTERL